ncbi:hypothetical protein AVEN_208592-1 [Araneus ventricosus]|uniref:Uncharacterized protein n=1 Tax=Araneus ventricosus TaxID=182803 RepID=A0A4Y2GKU3_ARAVE|nr:hypothetical protein AVEN_208592-1 [Araneus ventricosus]
MDIEGEENSIHLENVTDFCLERDNHNSSEKCQNISISENGPGEKRENSMQEERMSRKSEQIGHLDNEKPRRVSINIPLEKNKSPRNKRRYKKRYFCCGSLADGAIASANYSNVISVIMILSSLHVFFSNSKADDGTNKALAFSAIIYAICYIRSSTNLKRAIVIIFSFFTQP